LNDSADASSTALRIGRIAGLWASLMNRLRPVLMLSRVFVRELHEDDVTTQRDDGISVRVATGEDLQCAVQAGRLAGDFVEPALARGDICLAAFDGEALIAYVWRSFSAAPHADGLWVQVDMPYWYTYKAYTHPDYRGRRLSGLLTLFGDAVCRDRGYRRGVGFIETHNYPSIRANERLGSLTVGYAGYLKFGGRAYPFRTPGVKPHTFRFFRPR
jgi:GNAT superfamily N-acetyltransferase